MEPHGIRDGALTRRGARRLMNRKVTVVGGAGNVGATVARAIAEKGLADVVIIDIADQKAAGVALDIYETCPIIGSDSRVIGGGDWGAATGSDIVVVTSGATIWCATTTRS
jgi:malate dehydrogenase